MIRAANNAAITQNPELAINATLCCSCGVCAEVCCQDISPKDVILNLKGLLAKNKLRFTSDDEDYQPSEDRPYRQIPSTRWETMLGVRRFDKLPIFFPDLISTRRVEIPLAGHIGAPSIATVKVGDKVKRGDKIAAPAEGLSLAQQTSICGTVTAVDHHKIIIEQD